MDPILIPLLVNGTWTVLKPFVKKEGGKILEKAVGKVWDFVKAKMESKPETAELPAEVAKAPDDEYAQAAFRYQLKKLLENDEAFAQQLDALVKEAKQVTVTNMTATQTGDGAIAQGEGATAVGAGGVHVGGKASGNIITGDKNTVDEDDQKKKK
jgi:hypothetical protein